MEEAAGQKPGAGECILKEIVCGYKIRPVRKGTGKMQISRVLVLMKMDEEQKEQVRRAAGGARVDFVKPKELTEEQAAEAEVIIPC